MKRVACLALIVMCLCLARVVRAQEAPKYPFLDVRKPIDVRVADIVSRLTLEEKASLLNNSSAAVPRLGIKEYQYWNEGLHGIAYSGGGHDIGKFTVFPQAMAIAATWDPGLVHQITTAISDEAWGSINRDAVKNGYPGVRLLDFWSPTINMARDPRWGRTPETYGEDPWLTSRLVVAFVKGLQGDDPKYIKTVGTPKHFAANNIEYNRQKSNSKISEATLRDYYFPAFRAAVVEAGALSVMGAYNAINGVPCNADHWLLTDVLRNDWGFKGYVTTDCAAVRHLVVHHKYVKTFVEATAAVLKAGVDVECDDEGVVPESVPIAVEKGLMTVADVDLAVTHLMNVRMMLGMFDPPAMNPYTKISPSVIGSRGHVALARQVSRESIVLLKNDKVGSSTLLPLNPDKLKSVVVVGPNADKMIYGDYSGKPANPPVTPLDGIRKRLGNRVNINRVAWIAQPDDKNFHPLSKDLLRSGSVKGLKAEYFNNIDFKGAPVVTRVEECVLLNSNNAPAQIVGVETVSARWTGSIVPDRSGQYYFYLSASGSSKLFINGKLILESEKKKKMPHAKAGQLVENSALDKRLLKYKTTMVMMEKGKPVDIRIEYASAKGIGAMKAEWIQPAEDDTELVRNLKAIREADAVIAFIGLQIDDEREGIDRWSLDLPDDQDALIKQVRALNPRVVVVLVTGSSLSINWIKQNVPAILHTWYSGEEGGNAIADVMFGDYNPGGRLPMTFFKGIDDLPPMDDYEISHGKTYMYFEKEPLYPFGYGLSYTKFNYGKLDFDKKNAGSSDTVKVSVKVTNTGARDGDEVVQLYTHALDAGSDRPIKQLRGFQRIHLKKGASKIVAIYLVVKDLAVWNDQTKSFKVIPGRYDILVGSSSADIKQKDRIVVAGE
jgi:beta-glucosidase